MSIARILALAGNRGFAAVVLLALALCFGATGCGKKKGARVRAPRLPATPAVAVAPGDVEYGYASWYGNPYHGRRTANGEVYDMNRVSAAHRTLPFGTEVEVTNMENGRKVRVRINDRGPFVDGRIIDLSLGAAQQIALVGPGTAMVQLKVLNVPAPGTAPTILASRPAPAPASASVAQVPSSSPIPAVASAAPPPLPDEEAPQPSVLSPPMVAGRFTVQVGSFGVRANAERLRDELSRRYPQYSVNLHASANTAFHRVYVGNEPTEERARQVAERLRMDGLETFVVRLD